MQIRGHDRIATDREVLCSVKEWQDYVLLYDLSVGGCMIEVRGNHLCVGDEVTLNLDCLAYPKGTIVWKFNRNAGVEFTSPIQDEVVHSLGFRRPCQRDG